MQMYKRNKGITLVALIITIIILLILAGVSLSFVFNGGILDKAQSAVNEYQNASQKEQNLLDQIDKYIENELGDIANDEPIVPSVDNNGLATENTTIVAKDDSSIQIVIPKGFAPAILQTGTTQSLPGENGAVKEIMPADEWNNITKEDIRGYEPYGVQQPSEVILSKNTTNIGEYTFYECYTLNNIVIPESVTSIEERTFSECDLLNSIKIPTKLKSIGDDAFYYCCELKEIIIPKTIEYIGDRAFSGWESTQTIYFECSEDESKNWDTDWKSGCDAKIVWDYNPDEVTE